MFSYTITDNGRAVDDLHPGWFASRAQAQEAMDSVCPKGSPFRRFVRGEVDAVPSNYVRTLGSICHNEDDPENPDHRRVWIGLNTNGELVQADTDGVPDDSDYDRDSILYTPTYTSSEDALRGCRETWGYEAWDWQDYDPQA